MDIFQRIGNEPLIVIAIICLLAVLSYLKIAANGPITKWLDGYFLGLFLLPVMIATVSLTGVMVNVTHRIDQQRLDQVNQDRIDKALIADYIKLADTIKTGAEPANTRPLRPMTDSPAYKKAAGIQP